MAELVPPSRRISLYLSPHCASGNCNWCRERRERRRKQSVADSIAMAKPSTTFDYWNTPTSPRRSDQAHDNTRQSVTAPTGTGRVILSSREARRREGMHRKLIHYGR